MALFAAHLWTKCLPCTGGQAGHALQREFPADEGEAIFAGVDAAFELGVFGEGEHFFEARAGGIAGGDEVASGDEELRAHFFLGELSPSLAREIVERQVAVAGGDVEAMEGEVLVEFGQAEEAFEGGLLHLSHVAEAHVVFDEGEDPGAVLIGEAQAAEDVVGDADADFDVAVEADAVGRIVAEGGGFADVVEERAPGERG